MIKVVVISRKGKKKEILNIDKDMAVIGRTANNDVVLAKRNVSKHHARLVADDNGLLIEDLGSTNGTYVNGTPLEEPKYLEVTDKVIIGDFLLKAMVEEKVGEEIQPPTPPEPEEISEVEELEEAELIEEDNLPPPPDEEELELILEDEIVEEPVEPEAPETVEEGRKEPESIKETQQKPNKEYEDVTDRIATITMKIAQEEARLLEDINEEELLEYQKVLSLIAQRAEKKVFKDKTIINRDLSDEEWSYYSDLLMQTVEGMRRNNEITNSIDPYILSQDVLTEYTGYGAIDEVLMDERVRGIHVTGCMKIFVLRNYRWERIPKVFSSISALTRVMSKLVKDANIKDISARRYLRGRMSNGSLLQILLPPLVNKHSIIIERESGTSLTLQELVKAEVIKLEVVELLQQAIKDHENILICGPKHSGKTQILNACLSLVPTAESLVVVEDRERVLASHVNMVVLNKEALEAEPMKDSFILEGMGADWTVIEDIDSNDIKMMLELSVSARQALIATSTAANFQSCLDKLYLELTMLYPVLNHEDRQRMLYSTIDLVVTLGRAPNGRPVVKRVTRLSIKNNQPNQEVLFGE